jgi:PDDEXK-like domain of unknown function (DUF3799)
MMITQSGIYDLPMRIYRGQPADALSLSASDAICLSESTPMHLRQSWIDEPERDRKANMGTAIHTLALEPLRKHTAIRIIDAPDFRTKAAQEAAAEALADDIMPLLRHTFDDANNAVDAIRSHPDAAPLLDGGIAEQCYFDKHPLGVWLKARPDLVNGAGIIVDLKSVGSAEPEFIRRRIFAGGWFMQSSFHCDVYTRATKREPLDYVWICVEQKPPHAVAVYRPSRDAMAAGARKNAAAIATFAECARTGVWPGYPTGIRELGLPDFAHYRLAEEELAEGDDGP